MTEFAASLQFFLEPDVAPFAAVMLVLSALALFELVLAVLFGVGLSQVVNLVDTDGWPEIPLVNWFVVQGVPFMQSIRIAEVGGLGGSTAAGAVAGATAGGLGSEVVNAALRYRTAQPVVDGLLSEVGLKGGGNLYKLVSSAASLAGVALETSADTGPAPVAFASTESVAE